MPPFDENDIKRETTQFTMRDISNDQGKVISFRAGSECNEDDVERNYKLILSRVLNKRNTIVVTKDDRLIDLLSDNVEPKDRNYLLENMQIVEMFTLKPYTNVKHYATLVNELPLSVAEDLACSTEFTFGNLWFLVPPKDADFSDHSGHVIDDIRKLSSYTMNELPALWYEAIDSSAMHDGLEILWFKPDECVYEKAIKPLFKN